MHIYILKTYYLYEQVSIGNKNISKKRKKDIWFKVLRDIEVLRTVLDDSLRGLKMIY